MKLEQAWSLPTCPLSDLTHARGKNFPPQRPDLLSGPPSLLQWLSGTISLGIKRPGSEVHHSPPSSTEAENSGAILPLPHTSSRRSAFLIKYKDNFAFYLYFTVDIPTMVLF